MRIPKYRAWDKKDNLIAEVLQIDWSTNSVLIANLPSWVRIRSFDDIDLMQSTGLFDKNGVEIFEGDILQIDGYKSAYPVEWSEGTFYTTHYSDFDTLYKLMKCDGDRIKIIGNIYENPELLKEV